MKEFGGTFKLPRVKIDKLRQLILVNDVVDHHVSTFCLTCAFTWVCLVKAEVNELNDINNIHLVFQVDCRSRLVHPLPTTYFGNCVAAKLVVLDKHYCIARGCSGLFKIVLFNLSCIKGVKLFYII